MLSTPFTSRRPGQTDGQPQGSTRGRRAFSLIEILVVIGIILILVGILFVAVRRMDTTAKEHATHVALSNLQAMLAEYGSTTGFKTEPVDWVLNDCSVIAPTVGPPATSFWTALSYKGTPPQPFPIAAPGNVVIGNTTPAEQTHNAIPAVLNTMVAMGLITRVPANRTALANIPPQDLLVPAFCVYPILTPGPDNVIGTSDDGSATVIYPIGCHVKYQNKTYVSIQPNSDNPAPTAANWRDESTAPQQAPLVLDAWHNPIIYVPGSGMTVMLLNGGTSYDIAANPNLKFLTIKAPDNRPFWASAGPDGDFSRGDDNVYSFEQ
jgi:prepilin-type N-terminal cleavage/methylation domain-containing protein